MLRSATGTPCQQRTYHTCHGASRKVRSPVALGPHLNTKTHFSFPARLGRRSIAQTIAATRYANHDNDSDHERGRNYQTDPTERPVAVVAVAVGSLPQAQETGCRRVFVLPKGAEQGGMAWGNGGRGHITNTLRYYCMVTAVKCTGKKSTSTYGRSDTLERETEKQR